MIQQLLEPVHRTNLDSLSKSELVDRLQKAENMIRRFQRLVKRLLSLFRGKGLQNLLFKNKLFGKSSEKKPPAKVPRVRPKPRRSVKRVQLPSEKYPNVPIKDQDIKLDSPPDCSSCGKVMEDSGMTEDSEQLTGNP